jgi:hypothetical protein
MILKLRLMEFVCFGTRPLGIGAMVLMNDEAEDYSFSMRKILQNLRVE